MKRFKLTKRLISIFSCQRNVITGELSEKMVKVKSPLPYEMVPGPRALPILGNTWRFIPLIGM